MKFSANIGFLWADLPLVERIFAAKAAGFDAVEAHFPYDVPAADVKAALAETGFKMLGINTHPGDLAAGDFGLAAVPDRLSEAREAIDQAIEYAEEIGAGAVHVMAGKSAGNPDEPDTFLNNLAYALRAAGKAGVDIYIEPINTRDVPNYFLRSLESAAGICQTLDNHPGLKIMFDCYHLQILGGDLLTRYKNHASRIGHIQIASAPARAEPDGGEVNYPWLLPALQAAGYKGFFGAEYKPASTMEEGLGWLETYR
ncbi:MAG: TIM barrel protein [Pseudomonadota bacterium]